MGWVIEALDDEKTLWHFKTSHAWDYYTAKGYKFYYESDQCEKYLIVSLLKTEGFDKPFDGEQLTYNSMTYNVVVNRKLDSISSIQYPSKTQYLIEDKKAVHIYGDETIEGVKTFTGKPLSAKSNYPYINNIYADTTKGTALSSYRHGGYMFVDKNNKELGGLICVYNTDKSTYSEMRAYKANASNDTGYVYIRISEYPDGTGYATTITPTDTTSTSSTQIATTGWVNTVGNNVVHLTGNETISGIKTFANSNNPQITIKNTQYAYSDTQSSTQYWGIQFNDKNNVRVAKIEPYFIGSGAVGINLSCSTQVSGSLKYGALTVSLDASGNPTTRAITPATSDNSTKIATTAFVKAQGYITSALKLPNYSSAANKTVGTQYTATNNCMVICNGVISTNGDRETAISYFYINGAKYLKAEHFNVYGNGSAPFSFTVILQKGQTYKMAAEAYNCTAYKYVEIPLTA